jgi:UDP-perosamine 4-acetyltransferase
MKPVVVIGGGGHAKVIINLLKRAGRTIAGFTDLREGAKDILGVKRLGPDVEASPHEVELVNGVGNVRVTDVRRNLFEGYKSRGFTFAVAVHPAAIVAEDVTLHEGAIVMAGAVLQPGAVIGPNSVINTRASIDHDCQIGAHVHVAPGVTLSGSVIVGDDSLLGTASTVIQGIRIGKGVLVAAGAVVVRDLADGARAFGVPAR